MDVSPELLREVEFKEQWRGYNPDEVDDFLERVAVALGGLQARLDDSTARAEGAEAREAASSEEELRRTLVLAQRTADAALEDARQRASEIVAAAEAEAAETARLAVERAGAVVATAEARVETELAPLLAQRDALVADVEALRSWAASVRAGVAGELRRHLARIEDDRTDIPDRPDIVAVELPDLAEHRRSCGGSWTSVRRPTVSRCRKRPAVPPPDPDATGTFDTLAAEDDGSSREHAQEDGGDGHGALAAAAAGDPYLAELRLAVTDDAPLGPRDLEDEPHRRPPQEREPEPADASDQAGAPRPAAEPASGFRFRKRR